MNKYRKLIVAALGLGVIYAQRKYGIDLSGTEDQIADVVLNLGTLLAVWGIPNAQTEQPKCQCSDS